MTNRHGLIGPVLLTLIVITVLIGIGLYAMRAYGDTTEMPGGVPPASPLS